MTLCIVDNYYEKLIPQQRSECTSLNGVYGAPSIVSQREPHFIPRVKSIQHSVKLWKLHPH